MQIAYELTQEDFTEAYSVHRNRSTVTKWFWRIFFWIAGLFTAFIVFGFLLKPSVQAAKALLPFFVLLAVWVAILWILPRWTMRRQFTKQPGAHGPRTVLLDAYGAHWRWNGGSSDVEWKNYIRSVEGKNQILFYTSPACFNILPKRAIGAEQLAELRSLLRQNTQSRK
jgi:Ni/Fe-hydrogenase subunit HybB-like protein